MNRQFLAVVLISIVFLIVFGGVASILPSRKARQLGHLRVAARKFGLSTSLVHIDDVNASLADRVTASGIKLDPKKRCVAWSKPYPDECPGVPEWMTYAMDVDDSLPTSWQLHTSTEESGSLPDTYWNEVDRIKSIVPDRCIAIECTRTEVRWLGYEIVSSSNNTFIQEMQQGLDELIHLNVSISRQQSTQNNHYDTPSEYD